MTQQTDHAVQFALSEDRADIYFARTRTILQEEGLDPVVSMEVFPARDGIICGQHRIKRCLESASPPSQNIADGSTVYWSCGGHWCSCILNICRASASG